MYNIGEVENAIYKLRAEHPLVIPQLDPDKESLKDATKWLNKVENIGISVIGKRPIYESVYHSFYTIASSEKRNINVSRFLSDLVTGFGFGMVSLIELSGSFEMNFRGCPWFTKEGEDTSFAYIKGTVVGLLDGITGKEYCVGTLSAQMIEDVFTVTLKIKGK